MNLASSVYKLFSGVTSSWPWRGERKGRFQKHFFSLFCMEFRIFYELFAKLLWKITPFICPNPCNKFIALKIFIYLIIYQSTPSRDNALVYAINSTCFVATGETFSLNILIYLANSAQLISTTSSLIFFKLIFILTFPFDSLFFFYSISLDDGDLMHWVDNQNCMNKIFLNKFLNNLKCHMVSVHVDAILIHIFFIRFTRTMSVFGIVTSTLELRHVRATTLNIINAMP